MKVRYGRSGSSRDTKACESYGRSTRPCESRRSTCRDRVLLFVPDSRSPADDDRNETFLALRHFRMRAENENASVYILAADCGRGSDHDSLRRSFLGYF